jgi:hypothetical protein
MEPNSHAATRSTALDRPSVRFARRALLDAVFLGGLADALLHDGFGIGLGIWMTAFAITLLFLVGARGDGLRREQVAWLAAAVLFASSFAWRDTEDLLVYNFLAMLGTLAILGATLARGTLMRSILGQRLRDLGQSLGAIVKQVIGGVLSLAFADSAPGELAQTWRSGKTSAVIRASLIALPVLLVFGILFGSADPVFEKLLSLPALDWGIVASHVVVAGFFTWVVGGWLRGALVTTHRGKPLPETLPITLGSVEITVVLGGLVALFALFVGVQIGWLFGGEQLVRSTTGLSYAQYARHGFFELVWVSLLVLPVLLGAHAAIARDDNRALRRHRHLSLALLVLLGGVMASALARMSLYVHFYGLTIDRLFASVFMCWLAVVFVWLAITVLRGRAHDFAAGLIITGFVTLAGLNVANPAALVARVNIARASKAIAVADSLAGGQSKTDVASPIDYTYLANRLGGDAVDLTVQALIARPITPANSAGHEAEVRERCLGVRDLLKRWGATPAADGAHARDQSDWRTWNAADSRARRVVRLHERDLRAVTCRDASGEVPFGDRDRRPAVPGEQWYKSD